MKIEQLQPGQTVYNVMRRRMGNTTRYSMDVFAIKVIEVHPLATSVMSPYVMASWNGNRPRHYRKSEISKWKKDKPITITGAFGSTRLATREEIKAIKAKKAESIATQTEGYFNLITRNAECQDCGSTGHNTGSDTCGGPNEQDPLTDPNQTERN